MSRSTEADMLYAKRLQEMEREQLTLRLESQRQDAEYARRLAKQFESAATTNAASPPSLASPPANYDDNLMIQMGQKVLLWRYYGSFDFVRQFICIPCCGFYRLKCGCTTR
jgi:hypothetical protein